MGTQPTSARERKHLNYTNSPAVYTESLNTDIRDRTKTNQNNLVDVLAYSKSDVNNQSTNNKMSGANEEKEYNAYSHDRKKRFSISPENQEKQAQSPA